jgi:hypothetical protein
VETAPGSGAAFRVRLRASTRGTAPHHDHREFAGL